MLAKETMPPKPDDAPAVQAAEETKINAIRVQEQARAVRDAVRAVLNDPNALPTDQRRAWLRLDDAERAFLEAESEATDAQRDYTAALTAAREAWRPMFTQRLLEAVKHLDRVFTEHVVPANEAIRLIWAEAYAAGIELPRDSFWPEFVEPTSTMGARLTWWRTILKREGRL